MTRARGANSTMSGVFEDDYGVNPATGAFKLPFRTSSVGGQEDLVEDDTLGNGRNQRDQETDALDVDGDIDVPHDDRYVGYWLKHFLGEPVTTAALAASTTLTFSAQPAATSTMTLNGTVWTFVSGAPSGNQIQIGANLAATLTAAHTALAASSETQTVKNTYSATGTTLTMTSKTLGPSGNSYTIAADSGTNAALPANTSTLTGGANTHTFTSGADSLPSMFVEIGNPEVPLYRGVSGLLLNTLKQTNARKGMANLTLSFIGQNEVPTTASVIGTVDDLGDYQRFMNKTGYIRSGGQLLGEIEAGSFEFSNNLDVLESIRGDGLRDGADPAVFTGKGSFTARLSTTDMYLKAVNGQRIDLEYGYSIGVGRSIKYIVSRVKLIRPKLPVDGAGGLKGQYDWEASSDPSNDNVLLTVVLTNAVASY